MGTAPPADRRWSLLALLTSLYAAGALGVIGISPLTPILREGLDLTRLEVGLLVPAIYVGGLLFSLPGGRLTDRFGARACLVGGLVLTAAGLLAGSAAPGFPALLAALLLAGIGWSAVNPALGKAIIDLFPVRERGMAMGIKQTGLTLGGIVAALLLPSVAARWDWRVAVALAGALVALPLLPAWAAMAGLAGGSPAPPDRVASPSARAGWWLRRPGLLVFFGAGLGFGMMQSSVLSYLPLFAVQGLGLGVVGAGVLLAVAQTGGALARLGLGAASDRWLAGRRTPWLILTALLSAAVFLLYAWRPTASPLPAGATAFAVGVGTFGWVGLYMVISAEVGGPRQAGLLTGIGMASIVAGLLLGAPIFGLVLEAGDSYAAAWALQALVALAVAAALSASSEAIERERARGGLDLPGPGR